MKSFFKYGVVVIIALILFGRWVYFENYPSEFYSEPIYAFVTDENGNPLKDVIVVAYWKLDGGLEGGISMGVLKVIETVTDENGRFDFPAWGPIKMPEGVDGTLKHESPGMVLYKEGYKFEFVENSERRPMSGKPKLRASEWTGQTIVLKKFSGTLEDYNKMKYWLSDYLNRAGSGGSYCQWREYPKMLIATERSGFNDDSYYEELVKSVHVLDSEGCDSDKDFIKRYLDEK